MPLKISTFIGNCNFYHYIKTDGARLMTGIKIARIPHIAHSKYITLLDMSQPIKKKRKGNASVKY
jgi:hypothetical protein